MTQVLTKTFAEFFAGIGLVHQALKASGWECVYANDIEEKKRVMYERHFGPSPYYHRDDVWKTAEVVKHLKGAPFLATASFPCTDLSLAGDWKGFEGEESSTYFGFLKVLQRLKSRKPKLVMLENVYGFLTSKGGADFQTAVKALADEGYWIDTIVLDAKIFVPQSRVRVFVVGYHKSLKSDLLLKRSAAMRLGDPWQAAIDASVKIRPAVLRTLMESTELATGWATLPVRNPIQRRYSLADLIDVDEGQEWWDAEQTTKHLNMLSELHKRDVARMIAAGGVHVGTVYRRKRGDSTKAEIRFDGIAGCLRTPRGGSARQIVIVIDHGKVRFRWMNAFEYARLQGAEGFALVENTIQNLFGFGDAVCVPVVEWVDQNLLTPLYDEAVSKVGAPVVHVARKRRATA